ncbi:MAG TPA: hypothetical protein VIY47_01815 [Ignavibacteriaceae bacterium]
MIIELSNKILILFILFVIVYSCNDKETTAPTEENLLVNTSFENNGRFSSGGWTLPSQSDSSSDVPPNGGYFSLIMEAGNPPESAYIKVPVKTQFNKFKLTFWSKYSVVEGKAVLSLIRSGAVIKSMSILVEDIIWQSYTIQDTFTVATGDSFMVQFNGGIAQLFPSKTYFDLCQLQGIE